MNPEAAVNLVMRYSALTRAIKECKPRIASNLDQCPGRKGFRLETRAFFPDSNAGNAVQIPTDRAQSDPMHLELWYSSDRNDDGEIEWYGEIADAEQEECPHCYAAHMVVQERKALRRSLGAVKSSMTKLGAA